MKIHDLTGGDCCPENIPGYESTLILMSACDIAVFPDRPTYDPQDPGASVIIPADIELENGTNFVQIPILMNTGGTNSIAEGNVGSRGFRNEATFEILGNTAERLSWAQQVVNGCWVAVMEDKMGRKRVIGTKKSPAMFETIEVQNNSEDSKGTYLMYDTQGKIAPILNGDVIVQP